MNRRRVAYGILGLGLFAALWAFVIEPRRLVVHEETLKLPGFEDRSLRVALLSDLHVGSPHWGIERLPVLVDRVNALAPDIVILAGDYVIDGVKLGTKVPPEPIAQGLAKLNAKHGVVAVLGNHDWWNNGEHIRKTFEANGIVVLENEVRTIEHNGKSITIAGLADRMERMPDPVGTFAKAPKDSPVIAVIHEPDEFGQLTKYPALFLAGHTHGGQVRLPLLGRLVVPSEYGEHYAAGHVVENDHHLFVTTGVGTSILPVRFGVPPEIALLTLVGQ